VDADDVGSIHDRGGVMVAMVPCIRALLERRHSYLAKGTDEGLSEGPIKMGRGQETHAPADQAWQSIRHSLSSLTEPYSGIDDMFGAPLRDAPPS